MNETPVTADDLVLYALQLLEPQEAARIQSFLQHSADARAELARIHGDLAIFAMGTEPQTPPANLKQRFMKAVAREPKPVAAPAPAATVVPGQSAIHEIRAASPELPNRDFDRAEDVHDRLTLRSFEEQPASWRPRNFAGAFLGWTGWALAAGLGVATFSLYHHNRDLHARVLTAQTRADRSDAIAQKAQAVVQTMDSPTAQRFLLTKTDAQPIPMARVTYVPETGSLIFQGNNLEPLPASKTYELWLIPVGEKRQPVPAGLFKPDARGFASLVLPDLPKGLVAGKFGVTIEDDGGAAQPHGNIILIGS